MDGVIVPAEIDNATPYLLQSGYTGSTWHTLKISNATEYGRLSCITNASSTISAIDTPVNPIIPLVAIMLMLMFACRKRINE